MIDGETGTVITFNGEIYNYVELRDRLRAKGHVFRTHSDTEVILAAYREWGTDCVAQLGGMFAFALYDESKQRVLLARDRAGEKPLFYRVNDEQFTFASEAKALLADITDIKKTSPTQIQITMSKGNIDLPYNLSDYHIIVVPNGFTDWSKPDGTGAFTMEEFQPGVRFVAKKKPGNYWKPNRGNFDRVELIYIGDANQRTTGTAFAGTGAGGEHDADDETAEADPGDPAMGLVEGLTPHSQAPSAESASGAGPAETAATTEGSITGQEEKAMGKDS